MRLIDAEALKEYFPPEEDLDYPSNTNLYVCGMIDSMPTVDAVPVTRCRDCKHRDEQTANCTRFRKDWYVQSNSFCSWAERKDNETD